MRRAIAEAEVGDEQRFADPTTTRLEERVAELLGHEAALFLPSGTMCNQIAIRLHTRPGGDELIAAANSHPVNYEAGGPAVFSNAMVRTIDAPTGIFEPAQLEAAIRPAGDRYAPRSRLVSVEQTTNLGGGRVWPLETVRGGARGRSRARHARAPRRRQADERGGRERDERRRVGGRLRHGLDRLHEGARCAGRCRPRRLDAS